MTAYENLPPHRPIQQPSYKSLTIHHLNGQPQVVQILSHAPLRHLLIWTFYSVEEFTNPILTHPN